jgi:hypothetical protein
MDPGLQALFKKKKKMFSLLKAWMVWERYGNLFHICYHVGTPWPLPHTLPLTERSASKWLRHSIQFQLCFYLICSSLCRSWKGVCNLESKFLSKKRCLSDRQVVCLSIIHPLWWSHSTKIRHKDNSICSHILLEFCKTRVISREKRQ